jgi:hypothetical protein
MAATHDSTLTVEIGVDALMPFAEMTICGGDLTSELPFDVLELVLSSNHTRDALRQMA